MSEAGAGNHRSVRSYVVRGGRLTPSQKEAIDTLWPLYGIESSAGFLDSKALFGREAELVFEIGFGMGDSLVVMAREHPARDYIGIDVHPPGIGTLLREIHAQGLANLKVMQGDATDVLRTCFADGSLDRIQVFFPDPWHKKRHHKRRLIQPPFVADLAGKLRKGGILHLATDWQNYAEQMLEVMEAAPGFRNLAGAGHFAADHDRPETKFERRGRRLGHGVWDLLFEKI